MYVLKGFLPSLLLSQGKLFTSEVQTEPPMLEGQNVDMSVSHIKSPDYLLTVIRIYSVPLAGAQQQGIDPQVIVNIPDGLYAGSGVNTKASALAPKAVYNGGYEGKDILVRIANGGAGQSGLIGAWADAFIKHCVEDHKFEPFLVRSQFLRYLIPFT
jgi:hypothetical protein